MPVPTEYKALLLEGVNPVAKELLEACGCNVELLSCSLSTEDLVKKITGIHFLGIRSKTHVTKQILDAASNLLAVGCFCIGTNQVDLEYATERGVAVFNSPFANTRSVAELVICEIICLARKLTLRSREVHEGLWNKTHAGCYEVRGKTLGIIGYGHIGLQVGALAESLGMIVYFYDIASKMAMGNSKPLDSVDELLAISDFVTLHVPETSLTKGMISEQRIRTMKRGSYLLNLSRGTVVDLDALADALNDGHLAGAAVDVYPVEPVSAKQEHRTPLQGIPNVILTPHVGGSTCEAQEAIGREVGVALSGFVCNGSTLGSVNFPELALPDVSPGMFRISNTHENVPGALSQINAVVVRLGCNIALQFLATRGPIGYLVMDVDKNVAAELRKMVSELKFCIKTLILKK